MTVAAPGVLANDTDADGDSTIAQLDTGPAHGTLTLHPNGGFDYTPDPDFNGTDTFTYRASHDSVDLSGLELAPGDGDYHRHPGQHSCRPRP